MSVDLTKEDHVITEFLKSIGPWKKHVVIGGGYAPIIYNLYLADQNKENPPVATRDIDSLIPRKVPAESSKNIAKHLIEGGFEPFFKDRENPASQAYVKEIAGHEVEIEFLTDDSARTDKGKNVIVSGVVAQPLSYLNLSLQNTVEFKTQSGHAGLVVSPSAWMFHKGLTFTKRTSTVKGYKDLYGIWYVGSQLGSFSEKAIDHLKTFSTHHPKWFKTFQTNLVEWLDQASPIDWMSMEAQDPFGALQKSTFVHLLKRITLIQK